MKEVVTILEAEVEQSNWTLLEITYKKETNNIPESIKQTFLLHSQKEPLRWRIVTHWRSQNDLDQMRASEEIPVAVRIFQAAHAKPSLEIWDSEAHFLGQGLR